MIVLTESEEKLVKVIRTLPAGVAERMLVWASQLADVASGKPVDWSDMWTEDDLQDLTAASLRRFEESETSGR